MMLASMCWKSNIIVRAKEDQKNANEIEEKPSTKFRRDVLKKMQKGVTNWTSTKLTNNEFVLLYHNFYCFLYEKH